MNLKCIAISQDNYETLRNLGKTGMSFNDVISELIRKANNANNSCTSDEEWTTVWEEAFGNHTQTVFSPVNSDL